VEFVMQKRLVFAAAVTALALSAAASPHHVAEQRANRGPAKNGRRKFKGYMRKAKRRK
jgi:uncharacterized membrane protein